MARDIRMCGSPGVLSGQEDDRKRSFPHSRGNGRKQRGDTRMAFVKQFYAGTPFIPKEVWLQYPLKRKRSSASGCLRKRARK